MGHYDKIGVGFVFRSAPTESDNLQLSKVLLKNFKNASCWSLKNKNKKPKKNSKTIFIRKEKIALK